MHQHARVYSYVDPKNHERNSNKVHQTFDPTQLILINTPLIQSVNKDKSNLEGGERWTIFSVECLLTLLWITCR